MASPCTRWVICWALTMSGFVWCIRTLVGHAVNALIGILLKKWPSFSIYRLRILTFAQTPAPRLSWLTRHQEKSKYNLVFSITLVGLILGMKSNFIRETLLTSPLFGRITNSAELVLRVRYQTIFLSLTRIPRETISEWVITYRMWTCRCWQSKQPSLGDSGWWQK